jgi:hypothetical protein
MCNIFDRVENFRFRQKFRDNFRFPGSFRENGYVSAINIFKMINSNGNLTILVPVHYCCPICFEAPSGFDILRYFTIFPFSCVRFFIHFLFTRKFSRKFSRILAKIFVIFVTFRKLFSQKAKINCRENTKTKIFVSTLSTSR